MTRYFMADYYDPNDINCVIRFYCRATSSKEQHFTHKVLTFRVEELLDLAALKIRLEARALKGLDTAFRRMTGYSPERFRFDFREVCLSDLENDGCEIVTPETP